MRKHATRYRSVSCGDERGGGNGLTRGACKLPSFLSAEQHRRRLLAVIGAMAPPEMLKTIASDFDTVDMRVLNEAGRRIRLAWPTDRVILVGKRFRRIKGKARDEDCRVAGYLCCPEQFRFIGCICSEDFCDTKDVQEKDVYGWFPEVYLGLSGRLYVYVCHCASDSVSLLARSVDDFVKRGLRCSEFMNMAAVCLPEDVNALKLGACKTVLDVMVWRADHLGIRVTLSDGSAVRVCDQHFAGYSRSMIDAWTEMIGAGPLEILAVVERAPEGMFIPEDDRVVLLIDCCMSVYAAGSSDGIVLVAEGLIELTCRGLSRYAKNVLFHCDGRRKKLSRVPDCPNGHCHRNPSEDAAMCDESESSEDEPLVDGRVRRDRRDTLYRKVLRAMTEFQLR